MAPHDLPILAHFGSDLGPKGGGYFLLGLNPTPPCWPRLGSGKQVTFQARGRGELGTTAKLVHLCKKGCHNKSNRPRGHFQGGRGRFRQSGRGHWAWGAANSKWGHRQGGGVLLLYTACDFSYSAALSKTTAWEQALFKHSFVAKETNPPPSSAQPSSDIPAFPRRPQSQ